MTIAAPRDKKSSKARINWLLRQFNGCNIDDCFIRANWPGSSAPTSHAISDLLENPDLISQDKERLTVSSFMVFGSYRLAGRFSQLANFISDLEDKVPEFYKRLGQKDHYCYRRCRCGIYSQRCRRVLIRKNLQFIIF